MVHHSLDLLIMAIVAAGVGSSHTKATMGMATSWLIDIRLTLTDLLVDQVIINHPHIDKTATQVRLVRHNSTIHIIHNKTMVGLHLRRATNSRLSEAVILLIAEAIILSKLPTGDFRDLHRRARLHQSNEAEEDISAIFNGPRQVQSEEDHKFKIRQVATRIQYNPRQRPLTHSRKIPNPLQLMKTTIPSDLRKIYKWRMKVKN
jgi:hypothetical protein